jgi:hypothetical protein
MTEVIGGKDNRSIEALQMLEPSDVNPREDTSRREYPQREIDAATRTCPEMPVPRGKRHRLGTTRRSFGSVPRFDEPRRRFGEAGRSRLGFCNRSVRARPGCSRLRKGAGTDSSDAYIL